MALSLFVSFIRFCLVLFLKVAIESRAMKQDGIVEQGAQWRTWLARGTSTRLQPNCWRMSEGGEEGGREIKKKKKSWSEIRPAKSEQRRQGSTFLDLVVFILVVIVSSLQCIAFVRSSLCGRAPSLSRAHTHTRLRIYMCINSTDIFSFYKQKSHF